MKTAEIITKYSEIEYMYSKALEDHQNATGNEYIEGYRNALKHILQDLKATERSLNHV